MSGVASTSPPVHSALAPTAQVDLLLDESGRICGVRLPRAAGAAPSTTTAAQPLVDTPADVLFGQPVTIWLREAEGAVPPSSAGEFLRLLAADDGGADHALRWHPPGALQEGEDSPVPVSAFVVRFEADPAQHGTAPSYLLRLRAAASLATAPTIPVVGMRTRETTRALRLAEGALADQRERLGVTLDSITDAVATTDAKGRVTYLNPAAERLTGLTGAEAAGQPVEELYRRVGAQARRQLDNPVRTVLQTGLRVSPHDNAHFTDPEGNERVIAENAAPIISPRHGRLLGVVLVFHDITDRHRAAEELQRAGRIESLGLLAGGIAHDFNNLLASVLGNLSVARGAGDLNPVADEAMERGERACLRARELTGQLLTFARGGDPVRRPTALPELIRQAVRFSLMGASVRAECDFGEDETALARVDADEGQLTQVFHNLALNAVQAMPHGGMLTVRARNAHHAGWTDPPLPAGDYVVVTVADTGAGISAEHLAKIFDPFFTTKPGGTGLGLATTYSILRKHDGAIEVSSKVNHGTTFTIHLPASQIIVDGSVVGSIPGQGSPERRGEPGGGGNGAVPDPRPVSAEGGRILFMDDDSDIRELAGAMLALLGYETTLTNDGAAAIEAYVAARDADQPFAAVILDLTIPGGMGGKEAVKRLREIDPDVKAIVSSGYSNDAAAGEYRAAGFVATVGKPYRMDDLGNVLREVITGTA